MADSPNSATPDISFAIAAFNCVGYLEAAVRSALDQTGVTVEVLVVDDHSRDGTLALAHALADADPRIRVFQTATNAGPGGARNVALDHMRGRWLAILDSDDLVMPGRSAALIADAQMTGADMVADDLIVFGDGLAEHRFLGNSGTSSGQWLDLESYFARSAIFGPHPNPGFLKPMIRADFLRAHGVRYDEALRIGEDDDLIIQLLLAGARYRIAPIAQYRYRKHAKSISHRLSRDHVERMATADWRLQARLEGLGRAGPAFRRRRRALADAVTFTYAIDALTSRRPFEAAWTVLMRPTSLRLFAMPLRARLRRLFRP